MKPQFASRLSALMGFLAVALGAFGAHSLKTLLAQNGTALIWETAVFYHFIHAVMLFVLAGRKPFQAGAWWCFLAGIFFFLRVAVPAGGDECFVARRHYADRRLVFPGRVGVAGIQAARIEGLKLENAPFKDRLEVIDSAETLLLDSGRHG